MLRVLCGWKTGSGRTPFTGLCRSSRGAESEGEAGWGGSCAPLFSNNSEIFAIEGAGGKDALDYLETGPSQR